MIPAMGKVLAGTLVVLSMLFAFAPSAGAAEIPPTAKCVKTFKGLLREYTEKVAGNISDAEEEQANDDLSIGLAEEGCVSDAEPLIKEMPAKPFTEECVATADTLAKYWDPLTRRWNRIYRNLRQHLRPLNQRARKVQRRIVKLKAKDAPHKRIKPLVRKRKQIHRKQRRLVRHLNRSFNRVIAPQAYPITLTTFELVSRRCVPMTFVDSDKKIKGPVARVVKRNEPLLISSLFYVVFDAMGIDEAGATAGEPTGLSADEALVPEGFPGFSK